MSTRGIYGFRLNGEDKFVYNHSDSYPDYLGRKMTNDLAAILREKGIAWLKEKVVALRLVDDDGEPTEVPPNLQAKKDWYTTLRDCQGDIVKTLEAGVACESNSFIYDSLFCEWGYVVNLDAETLEIYKGYQKKSHGKGRYSEKRDAEYWGCALVKEIPFAELDDTWVDTLTADNPVDAEG